MTSRSRRRPASQIVARVWAGTATAETMLSAVNTIVVASGNRRRNSTSGLSSRLLNG